MATAGLTVVLSLIAVPVPADAQVIVSYAITPNSAGTTEFLSGIFSLDPATGQRTPILTPNRTSDGSPYLTQAGSASQLPDGELLVPNTVTGDPSQAALYRLNTLTGALTLVSDDSHPAGPTNAAFSSPQRAAVLPDGSYVDLDSTPAGPAVIRVDPHTGARSLISSNTSPTGDPQMANLEDVIGQDDGDLILIDAQAGADGAGAIIRIDETTGARTLISDDTAPSGSVDFAYPTYGAVAPDGTLIVTNAGLSTGFTNGQLISVNLQTGARTLISANSEPTGEPILAVPTSVTLLDATHALVTDIGEEPAQPPAFFPPDGRVISVDLTTGLRTLVSSTNSPSGLAFSFPTSVLVIRPEVQITAGPIGSTSDATPSFQFSSTSSAATFQCRVDTQGPFTSCASPFTTLFLPPGYHRFSVRAVDDTGGAGPITDRDFTVSTAPADTTAPTAAISSPLDGATFNQGQTALAQFTCTDEGGGSGLASCIGTTDAGTQLDTGVLGSHAFTVAATDNAGNQSTTTVHFTVADHTAPTITITTPGDLQTIPHGQPLSAQYTCNDEPGGSGLASCLGDVANGQPVDTGTLGDHTFTVATSDQAGNTDSETVHYTVIDVTAPTISVISPDESTHFVQGATILASYSCADEAGGSGLANCSGTVPSGQPLDTSAYGAHIFTVTASDYAGNQSSNSTHYTADDKTPPTISVTRPHGTYTVGQHLTASYSCSDNAGGSGVASCAGTTANGATINTGVGALGTHAFSVTAADRAGNSATTSGTYRVAIACVPLLGVCL